MEVNFEIVKNNFVGYFDLENCSFEKFKPYIRFLNKDSIVRDALSLNAPQLLRLVCTNSIIANEVVTFRILEQQY